jgi:hypothetical protein
LDSVQIVCRNCGSGVREREIRDIKVRRPEDFLDLSEIFTE